MRSPASLAVSAFLLMWSAEAAAQSAEPAQDNQAPSEVVIDGTRQPELKPYRIMSAGLDAFDEHRSRLAPNAELRFRLRQSTVPLGERQTWDGVTLRLAGDQFSLPLPVGADGTFTLPRSQAAYDEDADLVLNRKKSTIGFFAKVRSPGLPENARRMGDLRLECQVNIAIGKKELNLAQRAFYNTAFLGGDWCTSKRAIFRWVLDDWPVSATVVDKNASKSLAVDGYRFLAPIQDMSLSDDALITLEFWSQATAERKRGFLAQTPILLKSSVNKWGKGVPFREVEQGRYVARLEVPRGASKLRLESEGGQLALGGPVSTDTDVAASGSMGLKYHGGRLVIHADQPGAYEVSLDLRDPDHPGMAISRVES